MGNGADSDTAESLPPGLAGLDQPVFLFDADGTLTASNDAARALVGLSSETLAETTGRGLFGETAG